MAACRSIRAPRVFSRTGPRTLEALASGWRPWRAAQHRFGRYSAGTAMVVTMLTTTALAGAGLGESRRLVKLGGLF